MSRQNERDRSRKYKDSHTDLNKSFLPTDPADKLQQLEDCSCVSEDGKIEVVFRLTA